VTKEEERCLGLSAAKRLGCDECRAWARLKHARKLPVSGDTYCGECGARESDVSQAVRIWDKEKKL
jgi:hypothetical protein